LVRAIEMCTQVAAHARCVSDVAAISRVAIYAAHGAADALIQRTAALSHFI
jgi:hypothetical protein